MHALISCVGSAGDVHPFIAIGQALTRRGNDVEVLASPHFQARIEAAGLGFHPFGTEADYQRVVERADLWSPRHGFERLWREMQPQLVAAHAALVARARPGQTVLVGSTLAWHVRLAQETHGLRAVHGAVERGVLDRQIGPGLDAVRRWIHAPERVVCAWPEWFAPAQPDWPAQAVTTGFVPWPAAPGEALDPALEDFLSNGPAPVGFTPGSAMAYGRGLHDQFDNTDRWVSRGAGLPLSSRGTGWAATLDRLLNDPAIAAACGHHAAKTEPPGAAAQRIAGLIETLADRAGR